jgi:regulator of protease activity HflC (stomatin/prohibitin superfamily)
MSDIKRFGYTHHLRADSSRHIIRYRKGEPVMSGRGLAFWFQPLNTTLVEIPIDDRELQFLFHARSRDYQDVTVQGVINLRIDDPERLADRIDFSIDTRSGVYIETPNAQLASLVTELAQQFTWDYLIRNSLAEILESGFDSIRNRIFDGLREDAGIGELGLGITSVRVIAVRPEPEVEKALQTPAREVMQQEADRATFERRALAVEKERAIEENELQNQIELARREEQLIKQRGDNERTRVTDEADAKRIEAQAQALRTGVMAEAEAQRIEVTEKAKAQAEAARMAIYRDFPTEVLMALAAQNFATNMPTIEHLNVSPDMVGDFLNRFVNTGGLPGSVLAGGA